jgi:subtilase family serine protease
MNAFRLRYLAISLVLTISFLGAAQAAYSATGQFIANHTPSFVQTATEVGPADPSQTIVVTLWLTLHNRQHLDSVVQDLYDPTSPHFRAWLTFPQIVANYAPTADEVNIVKEFVSAHNLSIVQVDPNNFFVQARGTIAQVSAAFRVQMSNFKVRGKLIRANKTDPYVDGAAASVVHVVSGLSNARSDVAPLRPMLSQAPQAGGLSSNAGTLPRAASAVATSGTPSASASSASVETSLNAFFASDCFQGTTTDNLNANGGLPTASYTGNLYATAVGGCSYTPTEIQAAYGLSALYQEGYSGQGQTIVIFEICNTATIQSDANAFSAQFGLPALTSANFAVVGYPVAAPCSFPDVEETLDVEWAHAIAPGANIVVLVAPDVATDAGFAQDVDLALIYASAKHLGNVISFSYGLPEIETAAADLEETNLLNEIAASLGIAVNFSSGDDGDYTQFGIPPTVEYPASGQYVTAVGGISLALNGSNAIVWQAGWGNNSNVLDNDGLVSDPPQGSFFAGAGGGPSAFFSKPSFQSHLPGSARLLPDISWLADPNTGVVLAETEGLTAFGAEASYPPLQWFNIGGTSVACPMFSALWAIANQEAGKPLGQAARYVYSMPSSTITDIVPVNSSNNVTGTVTDMNGTQSYGASELAQPLDGVTVFYDALANVPLTQGGQVVLITFGTDTNLKTAPGWDNVTGVGVPKPKAFADYFK